METKKRLLMTFKTASDKKISISVDNPRDNISEQEIKTAMTTILAKDIFKPGGESLASMVEAKIVETATTEYDLVV